MLSWTEMQSHVCRPNPAKMSRKELIARILTSGHTRRRTYGTGSVFQARNGTWYGFLTVGKGTDGKRIRKKITGSSQEEVESKLESARQETGRQSTSRPRPLSNRSIDQLRSMYTDILAEPNRSSES
jgi:hypothetical protein